MPEYQISIDLIPETFLNKSLDYIKLTEKLSKKCAIQFLVGTNDPASFELYVYSFDVATREYELDEVLKGDVFLQKYNV